MFINPILATAADRRPQATPRAVMTSAPLYRLLCSILRQQRVWWWCSPATSFGNSVFGGVGHRPLSSATACLVVVVTGHFVRQQHVWWWWSPATSFGNSVFGVGVHRPLPSATACLVVSVTGHFLPLVSQLIVPRNAGATVSTFGSRGNIHVSRSLEAQCKALSLSGQTVPQSRGSVSQPSHQDIVSRS